MLAARSPVYMNLKATNQNMVEVGAAVKFDEIKNSDTGIMYLKDGNSIMFTVDGIFFFSWWISIINSGNGENFSTTLEDQNNRVLGSGEIGTEGANILSELSICANQVVKVCKGDKLKLINRGGSEFRLSRENGFSGEMTISEIDSSGPYISVRNSGNIGSLRQGGIINMDTVDITSNFMYKDVTITVIKEGMYLVAWKVQIDTSNIFGNLNFTISVNKGGVQLLTAGTQGDAGFIYQIVQGFGVINLMVGDEIGLYNMSDSDIALGIVENGIPMNLGVFKI